MANHIFLVQVKHSLRECAQGDTSAINRSVQAAKKRSLYIEMSSYEETLLLRDWLLTLQSPSAKDNSLKVFWAGFLVLYSQLLIFGLHLTGHVHAYERSHRGIYKEKLNSCGPTYVNIGDGGNR